MLGQIPRLLRWSTLIRLLIILLLMLLATVLLLHITTRQTNSSWVKPNPLSVILRPHVVRYVIENPNLCKKADLKDTTDPTEEPMRPFLHIFVESAPNNFEKRTEWRECWGKEKRIARLQVTIAFLLAKSKQNNVNEKIKTEYRKFGDVIQSDYLDSYQNLTRKTISGFHWTVHHCTNARFVMKTDDDVILFLPRLVRYLRDLKLGSGKDLYTGYGSRYHEVQRSAGDRWQVSKQEYPYRLYPPYILGMGILLSNNAMHKIYEASLYIPSFKFEDVFVGMCARYANIERTNNDGFVHFFGPELEDYVCEYRKKKNSVYLIHGLRRNRTEFYQAVVDGKSCTKPKPTKKPKGEVKKQKLKKGVK